MKTMPACTAPRDGHRSAAAKERCPACRASRVGARTGRQVGVPSGVDSSRVSRRRSGFKEWVTYLDDRGRPHRDDGPAEVEFLHGSVVVMRWFRNGVLHREGGPAVVTREPRSGRVNATFYVEGRLHRLDGPASPDLGWYLDGQAVDRESVFRAFVEDRFGEGGLSDGAVAYLIDEPWDALTSESVALACVLYPRFSS